MDKKEILKMLKEEVVNKVDSATLDKLKAAGSKDEAFSILRDASIELNDEMLDAVAGGVEDDDSFIEWCSSYECEFFEIAPPSEQQ